MQELLRLGVDPCGIRYMGVDVAFHACGRPLGHAGEHYARASASEVGAMVWDQPRCDACLEPVELGFIRLGNTLLHIDCFEPGCEHVDDGLCEDCHRDSILAERADNANDDRRVGL